MTTEKYGRAEDWLFGRLALEVGNPRRLTPLQALVWIRLDRYANADREAWPSQQRLAKDLGCTERAVKDALRQLEAQKLVARQHRQKRGRWNVYVLHSGAEGNEASPEAGSEGTEASPRQGNEASPDTRVRGTAVPSQGKRGSISGEARFPHLKSPQEGSQEPHARARVPAGARTHAREEPRLGEGGEHGPVVNSEGVGALAAALRSAWVAEWASAREGRDAPSDLAGSAPVAAWLADRAERAGVDARQLMLACVRLYWREEWPRARGSNPKFRHLERFLPALADKALAPPDLKPSRRFLGPIRAEADDRELDAAEFEASLPPALRAAAGGCS